MLMTRKTGQDTGVKYHEGITKTKKTTIPKSKQRFFCEPERGRMTWPYDLPIMPKVILLPRSMLMIAEERRRTVSPTSVLVVSAQPISRAMTEIRDQGMV